jgi:hypothetical protein
MKKSLIAACLVSVFAVSSFAQSTPAPTPAQAGAKLVAERDASWAKAHPGGAQASGPTAAHEAMRAKAVKPGKHARHAKHPKHAKPAKHGKHAKHVKHKANKAA